MSNKLKVGDKKVSRVLSNIKGVVLKLNPYEDMGLKQLQNIVSYLFHTGLWNEIYKRYYGKDVYHDERFKDPSNPMYSTVKFLHYLNVANVRNQEDAVKASEKEFSKEELKERRDMLRTILLPSPYRIHINFNHSKS